MFLRNVKLSLKYTALRPRGPHSSAYKLMANGKSGLATSGPRFEPGRLKEQRVLNTPPRHAAIDFQVHSYTYEGYSESNLRLFLATNIGAGESSRMRGSVG
jgi:hypothetical protein